MVYLINGEKSLIDKEVSDLIKKYNTTSIIKYDLIDTKISDVINDIDTVNLFLDKKLIICSSLKEMLPEIMRDEKIAAAPRITLAVI